MSHILGGNVSMPLGALNTLTGGYEFTYRDSDRSDYGRSRSATGSTGRCRARSAPSPRWASPRRSRWIAANTDSRIFNVSLFAAHGVPGGFSVSGSVGYSLFDSDSATDLTHLVSVSLNASYRFARGIVSVGVFQDFRQTADEGEDFGIVTTRSANGSFSYSITAFITGSDPCAVLAERAAGGGRVADPVVEPILTAGANLELADRQLALADAGVPATSIATSDQLHQYRLERLHDQTPRHPPELDREPRNRSRLTASF